MDFLTWCNKYHGQLPCAVYTALSKSVSDMIASTSPLLSRHISNGGAFTYHVSYYSDMSVTLSATIERVSYAWPVEGRVMADLSMKAMQDTLTNLEKEYYL